MPGASRSFMSAQDRLTSRAGPRPPAVGGTMPPSARLVRVLRSPRLRLVALALAGVLAVASRPGAAAAQPAEEGVPTETVEARLALLESRVATLQGEVADLQQEVMNQQEIN